MCYGKSLSTGAWGVSITSAYKTSEKTARVRDCDMTLRLGDRAEIKLQVPRILSLPSVDVALGSYLTATCSRASR